MCNLHTSYFQLVLMRCVL